MIASGLSRQLKTDEYVILFEHLTRRVLLWVFVWIASLVFFAYLFLFLFCKLYFFNGCPALEMALCTVCTWQGALVTDVCTQVSLRLVIFVYTPQAIKRVRIYASFGTYVWLLQQPVHRRFTMMYECVQCTQYIVVSYTTSPCLIFPPLCLCLWQLMKERTQVIKISNFMSETLGWGRILS